MPKRGLRLEPKTCDRCKMTTNHRLVLPDTPFGIITWRCLRCGNEKQERPRVNDGPK